MRTPPKRERTRRSVCVCVCACLGEEACKRRAGPVFGRLTRPRSRAPRGRPVRRRGRRCNGRETRTKPTSNSATPTKRRQWRGLPRRMLPEGPAKRPCAGARKRRTCQKSPTAGNPLLVACNTTPSSPCSTLPANPRACRCSRRAPSRNRALGVRNTRPAGREANPPVVSRAPGCSRTPRNSPGSKPRRRHT